MTDPPTPEQEDEEPTESRYAPPVLDALSSEFYKSAIGLADAARARAQTANGIASGVAAVLIGTAVFVKFDQQPNSVRVIGMAAVVSWVAAAALFVFASAVRTKLAGKIEVENPDEFVAEVLERVRQDRKSVEDRLRFALFASGIAAALTLVSVAVIVFHSPDLVVGEVVVTEGEASAARTVCPNATSHISGELEVSSLNGEFLTMRPDASSCGNQSVVLRIPRGSILVEKAKPSEGKVYPLI